jgi:hypothetical protein
MVLTKIHSIVRGLDGIYLLKSVSWGIIMFVYAYDTDHCRFAYCIFTQITLAMMAPSSGQTYCRKVSLKILFVSLSNHDVIR